MCNTVNSQPPQQETSEEMNHLLSEEQMPLECPLALDSPIIH
jgi:hypothetical protein